MRSCRSFFSSSVFRGSFIASATRAYAALSSSTSRRKSDRRLSVSSMYASSASDRSFLIEIRPTIAASAAPMAPAYAAALPPPGTGESAERSSVNARRERSMKRSGIGTGPKCTC